MLDRVNMFRYIVRMYSQYFEVKRHLIKLIPMNPTTLIRRRLFNQEISRPQFNQPEDVVAWLGAVQAQDYPGGKWTIATRLKNARESAIEQAIIDRKIIRTWPLRGTLHFVTAKDIHWILQLIKPHIMRQHASFYKRSELDEKTLTKCFKVIVNALSGGKQLMRSELADALHKKKIQTDSRLSLILYRAAVDQLICFGQKRGNQFTFTLLDEWAPTSKTMAPEESLRELTLRYFQSRGPASLKDFMWWTGLPKSEALKGIASTDERLTSEVIAGDPYWYIPTDTKIPTIPSRAVLLSSFDEYLLGYKDRSAMMDTIHNKRINPGNAMFSSTILLDGRVTGLWKRTLKKDHVHIDATPLASFSKSDKAAISTAVDLYARYLELKPELNFK